MSWVPLGTEVGTVGHAGEGTGAPRPLPEVRNAREAMATGSGTKDDPWELTTAPGSSTYTMHLDEGADPPMLVCQVGSTKLTYLASAIDDLHAWLVEQGDWVDLGAADVEQAGQGRHRGGVRTSRGQPGRRLVRPAQGLPRPVRDVPAPLLEALGGPS